MRSGEEHDSGEHPHFVCVDCGKVTCLPEVDVKITPPKGARGSLVEVSAKPS
jgi:Fur family ferric uptake transcriptional regulator